MADSVVTVTVQKTGLFPNRGYEVKGTLAVGAAPGTYPTGGYTVSFADSNIKASRVPKEVTIHGRAGYVYTFIPGTTNADGKVMVLTGAAAQSPLTELAAGATPAGVSGDTIQFTARWDGMQ